MAEELNLHDMYLMNRYAGHFSPCLIGVGIVIEDYTRWEVSLILQTRYLVEAYTYCPTSEQPSIACTRCPAFPGLEGFASSSDE